MMQIQIDGEKAIEEIESILGDAKKKKRLHKFCRNLSTLWRPKQGRYSQNKLKKPMR